MLHETSLGLVYDGWDEGMHQAFGCGVFGLVLQASSRSIFSTSCLILTLALLDFFLGGGTCNECKQVAGFDCFVFWALGVGISFTNLDTRAIVTI
jgi:hypothetical protein